MGNPPDWVAEKLLLVLDSLPHPFTWGEARELLLENGVNKEEVEAMLHALRRVPGMAYDAECGLYRRPLQHGRNVRHRAWRITPRRLDVHDATVLRDMLERYDESGLLTPNLMKLVDQLRSALEGLG